jgi:hypothetical protein
MWKNSVDVAHACKDVTTRGNYYPDKSLATAAVSTLWKSFQRDFETSDASQSPPLYLHVTSTSKDGLEKAVTRIEELMKQELPNLVDERRFRRREPEQVERDEFGRVLLSAPAYDLVILTARLAQMARGADCYRLGTFARLQLKSTGCWTWRCIRQAYSARNSLSCPD